MMQAARKCISGVVVISAVWWFDLFLGVEWIGIVFKVFFFFQKSFILGVALIRKGLYSGTLSGAFYFGLGNDMFRIVFLGSYRKHFLLLYG